MFYGNINFQVWLISEAPEKYCIASMLRSGISAHPLVSTLVHHVNLRFVRGGRLMAFNSKWKTVDFDCVHPTITDTISSSILSFDKQIVGWPFLYSRLS